VSDRIVRHRLMKQEPGSSRSPLLAAALFAHGMATLVEHGLARLHGDGLSYEMPTPNVAA
jgi:hypothetical protein